MLTIHMEILVSTAIAILVGWGFGLGLGTLAVSDRAPSGRQTTNIRRELYKSCCNRHKTMIEGLHTKTKLDVAVILKKSHVWTRRQNKNIRSGIECQWLWLFTATGKHEREDRHWFFLFWWFVSWVIWFQQMYVLFVNQVTCDMNLKVVNRTCCCCTKSAVVLFPKGFSDMC